MPIFIYSDVLFSSWRVKPFSVIHSFLFTELASVDSKERFAYNKSSLLPLDENLLTSPHSWTYYPSQVETWLMVVFPQHLINMVPFPPKLHGLWEEICCQEVIHHFVLAAFTTVCLIVMWLIMAFECHGFVGLSLLGLTQFLESVGLGFSTNLRIFVVIS